MLLVYGLACCVVAARAAPTTLRCLPESQLDGYCRRRLDGDAPLINGLEPAQRTGNACFGYGRSTMDDESARTKDFKPGTNAQRHRFYHIHQHGRTSSRLTDLIRSSFRRVNVSGVDDKEPAASEEPVTAPPTARRQLTWRASAPGDYGTIE